MIPAILAAVPAITSLVQGIRQNNELKRLKEQGANPISPYLQEAVTTSRMQAGVSQGADTTAEMDLLDRSAASAAENVRVNAKNSGEALSAVANLEGKRGQALQGLFARNEQSRNQKQQELLRTLFYAGQQDQANKTDYQDEVYNLTAARDTNLLNAPVHAANAVLQGAGDEQFLDGGLFAGVRKKKTEKTPTGGTAGPASPGTPSLF